MATVHPSSLLRLPDKPARDQARQQFIDDFNIIAEALRAA
jgi:uracil-DNA glycosylase